MRVSSSCFCTRRGNRMFLLLAIAWPTVAFLPFLCVQSVKITPSKRKAPQRPQLVADALEKGQPIHYFGLGSNMSRKKVENRGPNGTKIEIESMGPAFVPNHRLAFNLRGFPPIEPGMGSLEPVDSGARALLTYEGGECHGALIRLTPENYEKVMRSEGVGNGQSDQGYEEIVVEAYPYENPRSPVKAVALRARDHVRLDFDPCPSARYMSILREGAEELGLRQSYQEFLQRHPVETLARWQRKQAIFNVYFMFSLSTRLKWRGLSKLQNRILFLFYTPDSSRRVRKALSVAITALVLLPGSLMGLMTYHAMKLLGKTPNSWLFKTLDSD